MTDASTINHVLRIRRHCTPAIRAIRGVVATAVGLKDVAGTAKPALFVFVDAKLNARWLHADDVVPPILAEPGGLECPTDVIEVGPDMAAAYPPGRLSGANLALRGDLRGGYDQLSAGSQLGFVDASGGRQAGSLATFAYDRQTDELGLITNAHVGEFVGNALAHPESDSHRRIAEVTKLFTLVSSATRFGADHARDREFAKVDAMFATLRGVDVATEITFEVPILVDESVDGTIVSTIVNQPLGARFALDLDDPSCAPLREDVVAVGRTRSFQRGRIECFAYELAYGPHATLVTDYVIAPANPDEYFSDAGDSGKLVVTESDFRPIALLWGGKQMRTDFTQELVDHSFATDIGFVCDLLDVEIAGTPRATQ